MAKLLLVLGVLGLLLGAATSRAGADGPAGADVQVAQSLGDRELTVIIRRIDAPGPLPVEVVTHAGTPAGRLELRAGTGGAPVSATTIELGQTPGFYRGTLTVDRSGPWELAVDDGIRVATIPFLVPARVSAPWDLVTYGGFVAAGVLLLAALGLAVFGRVGLAMVPAAGMIAALAAAITAGLLSPVMSQRTSIVDLPRPPVNLVAHLDSADLRLHLTDGMTGQPVDDLVVRDNALLHLMVVTPSGGLRHLHPVRVAPGDYRARFAPAEPGGYAIAAELARRGGGTQLARTSIRVDIGSGGPPDAGTAGLTTTIRPAGAPSTITADFGAPTLQPWLGMLGHLIVVGPVTETAATAPIWAHVHAMLPATPGFPDRPDESVAAFGPVVRFSYTFPLPGRYLVWIQVERDYKVITVPATIEVPRAGTDPAAPPPGGGHAGHQTR